MKGVLRDMRSSIHHREFWAYAVWLDIATRYRRTRLGVGWLLLPPLAYVLGIGYLYSHMMGGSPGTFIPHLGFGYILWRLSIQTMTESADVFAMHQAFIMDGRTRFTDFILRTFAKSFLFFMVGLLVVVTIVLMVSPTNPAWLLTLAFTLPVLFLNILWMSIIISLFGARFPDTKEMIGTILIFGFLLTPILWDASMVPPETIRGLVMRFNPFFHLIEFVRAPALGAMPEATTLYAIGAMSVFGWVMAAFLYRRYARFVPLWI
ncbi:ABC transporter permease [Novilysobacter erysipheiresistens]|uniref:ABC transporter permease n=1 Tax=Novilysobacter erysipheiresistens TaxID=1749332 RepID=A0ABU7YYY0_9GAMM